MAENLFLKNPLDPSTQDAPSLDIPAIPRITTESRAPEVRQSSRVMRTTGLMPPQDLQPKFEAAAAEAGVPVNVLAALASQESNYNSEAVGQPTQWGRAKGMLQYIDPTAKSIGINPFDADQSIKAAAKQLRQRLDNGDTMEEAVMAHFGGDDRAKWGPKTRAYGEEVLGKAGIIGKGLMDQQPAQAEPEAPSYDLKSIQAELDAKESGRFKVLTAEEAAAMQAKGPAKAAVTAEADDGPDGFMSATGKALKNVPQNLKNSAGGLIRSIGEGIDDQSLVVQAKQAGILDQMQGTGDLVFKADSPEGKKRPYLKDGTFADTAVLADYIRKNAASLLPSDEAAANMTGMQPGSVSQYGADLSADARKSMVQVNPDGPLAKYGSMIIGSTAEMLPALTASVLARSPQPMMAIMGGQVFGQSYDKAREKGMNAQEAGGYATAQAVAEAIPEALPLHFILKPGQQFFKGLLTAGAAESLQEGVTQAIQSGIDKGTLDPNMTWGEAVEQIRDAMIVGAGSGALMRGGVHGVQKLTNRDAAPAADPSADPTAPVDQAAPQDRVEPTITEQPAPNTAQEAPNTTAPAPNIAPAPAAPTGPLTRAAAQMDPAELAKLQQGVVDAAAQEQAGTEPAAKPAGEPVTVRGSDGEMPGTLESYQEDGKGGWTARVLADDGNAYDFTQDDGVTLDRPAAAGTSPAAQPVAEPSPAQMDEPVAQPEETSPPTARQIKDMSVPELRAELKEVAAGIREDRTDASLKARRKDIEKAINAAVEGAIKDPSTAARHVERATNLPKPDAKKASPEELAAADIENSRGRDELAKRAEEYRKWKSEDDARKGAEKAAVDAVAGEKINGRWSRFSPDTGTLGVPRADMPQIKAEHRGAMTQFLNARGIEHRQEEVPARDLKPTQEEFSPAKVKQAIGFTGGDRAILVSSDGHILDGHHQWLAKYAENQPVKIIRLDAPIKQLLETVREFPSAGQSNGSTVADVKQTAADVKETVDPVKETPTYDEKIQRGYASVQRYAREMADKAKANKGDAKAQNDAKVAARDVENYTKRHAKTLGLDGAGKSAPDTARAAELNKQAAEAYSRGHAITHDENGLRTHENSPSPQEKLEAEEHFTESARLNIEEKRALGEEPGAIQLANYDRRVRDLETRREQVKNLASKPAETASVPAKTASKPAEPASDQPKPAFKTPKQKALERKVQLQRKARETIGAEEGEQITLSDDVGYATGGRTYTVESINTDGSVTISSERGKTDLSRAELQGAINRGVTISRVEKPAAAKAKPEVSQNTLVSDDRAAELRQRLKGKLGQLNSGIDPEIVAIGTELAVYHIERGARTFAAYAKAIAADLGTTVQALRPYLRSWYNGSRDMMEDGGHSIDGMDSSETVRAELAKIDSGVQGAEPVAQAPASKRLRAGTPDETLEREVAAINQDISDIKGDPALAGHRDLKARELARDEVLEALQERGYSDERIEALRSQMPTGYPEPVVGNKTPYARGMATITKTTPHSVTVRKAGKEITLTVSQYHANIDGMEEPAQQSAQQAATPATQTVTTPSGREFEVRSKVVEADDLVTSNHADGSVNKEYPQDLQPRDRTRSASLDQINDIASKLNPRLLGDSASVTDGAPIVSSEGVVESGNGRTMSIRQAYARHPDVAGKYRDWLKGQGFDVDGMKAPVLVRERITPMDTAELQAYTGEANERTTLALSSTERATSDAKKIGGILHLYRGGDVSAAANRDFVRGFMSDVVAKSDRGSVMDADGMLSQDGRRRIEAGLLAAAYSDSNLVNDLFESADTDIKSIGGALLDASGEWAQMRQEARDGSIPAGVDITPNLMEAVNLVRRARAEGRPIFELVNQSDIFAGDLSQTTKDLVSVFYRGDSLSRARSRDKVSAALLSYTQQARAAKPGDNLFGDPELTGDDVLRGVNDKLQQQEDNGGQASLFGGAENPAERNGGTGREGQRPRTGAQGEGSQTEGGSVNAPDSRGGVEQDRQDTGSAKPVDADSVRDAAGQNDASTRDAGASARAERDAGQRDNRVPDDGATADGTRGDKLVHQPDGQFRPESGTARGSERTGSGRDSEPGAAVEQERADAVIESAPAADARDIAQRVEAQRKASKVKTKRGDKANIDEALPLLLPPQREDVLKAEIRHAIGNGMLFTNGTGTGKTASGLGVAKRFIGEGKDNIIIVVPSDKIASDWVKFAGMMDINLKALTGTTDNGGAGPVITTYANFGANETLAQRNWDLAITDESHYLSSNEAGQSTGALEQLRALTGHHDGFYKHVREANPAQWKPYLEAMNASRDAAKDSSIIESQRTALAEAEAKAKKVWDAVEQPARKAWDERWSRQEGLPKTVFLSATPFPYVKNVDYAEGYLFNYVDPADMKKVNNRGDAYNSGDAREKFFMQHFGYRMRYNKLTAPEAGVDSELMEQNFNQWLKDAGSLSGRRLEVEHDYDRKFATVDDAVGQKIDEGLKFLREEGDGKYREAFDAVSKQFDYHRRQYLLESIKARAAVPVIKEHLALGRKVVLFHDFNKGGGFDPFDLNSVIDEKAKAQAREAFAARPDLFRLDLKGLNSPIVTLKAAFPDALFFNGTVPKRLRRENADAFNDDNGDKHLIVVQSDAGREGVSLHDTSGKHQRVLINLGMPGKPVAAIQIEGRTYRTGQASDAIFRYLTTGTAWEASAFATKIAERASTAENLALGTDARGLKQSFIDAYNSADEAPASREDGKGGKAYDRSMAAGAQLSGFQKAKTYYFAQQKNTRRRDQREGTDYFATPEPLGFKMAEWANINQGDKVLEPSAGHGAIARFFPPRTDVTMVEPSYELSQRAALANGAARIVNDRFEDLHLTNKYDAVVMNPPYGSGGKTAIEHVAKAVQHLRDGGRVVALIPRGNLADKRLETFLASPEAADMHIVADIQMPASTFERAGTAVNTHVIILEKHANPADAEGIQQRNIDLSNAQSVGELFDRIEDLGLPERQPSSKPEPKEEIVEHVTGKGKVLRGVVRQGLTKDEAKEIDPFTFKKDGGYFIRAKHLDEAKQSIAAAPDLAPQSGQADRIRDTLLASPLGKSITRLMGEGRIVLHNDSQTLPATSYPGTQALTMPDGTVHLVADSLTPSSAVPVLLHEMFHSGGESLVGSKRWGELQGRLSSLYSQFEKSPGKAGEFFQAARQRVQDADAAGNKMGDALTAEEFGAYAIEQYARAPETIRKWVDGVTGAVKEFMFRRFGIQLGQVSPAQLRAMAVQALDQQAAAPTADTRYSVKPSEHFTDLNADQKTFLDKIGPERLPQKLKDRWSQLTNNLALRVRQAGVDRYAALLRNDKLLHGEDTLEGSIASSSWVLARMSPSAGGAVSALLNNGRIYLDTKEKVIDIKEGTEGLGATLRKLGSPQEIDRFMGWIAANRSKRLLAEGRENLFTAEEIEAGIKLSGGKLENGKSRSLLYAQAWKDFQQHRDDVLGIAESTGIITPEQRETWSEEFYVPFYRVTDEDSMGGPSSGSGLSRQQAYKKLKGGKQHLNDLLDNTLLNFHHLLQASLKNQAAAQAMENAKQLGIAQETTESKRDKKMSTFVMVDGEKQWYDVGDALTFKAVSALADAGLNNPAMKVGRAFKRFFTNMTTITPQFVVANAIRDTLAAMATSPTSFVPLKTAFKGALTYGNDTAKARMMASGGAFSFGHVYGQNATELKASLTQSMRGAKVLSDPKLIPGALLTAWRKYHAVTDFAENMNRAGIWEHNQGRGKLKAAFEARDLMDFSAHGDAAIIRIMTDLVPFMNARIQGLDKLYRSGAKPAIKTLFGKGSASDKQSFGRFVAVVGALTAMSALLYLRNKDDEDYRKLEDWQRDTYWPIKIGDSMFFIPKPFEVGSIATMGERLLEQFVDPTVGGEKLASRAAHMLGDTFAFNPIPQVVKPLYELGANENTFTGRPIEDQSMQKLSPSLRSRPETSRLADVTSRGLEAALDAVGGKNAALSPVQIDHLIQGYTGAVGATAVGMADTIWRRASGEELPARRWSEYQPIKRFYKDLTQEDNYTRYGTDFYSALKKVDQDYADFQHLVKFGQDERALELSNDKGDELALRGSLVKVSRSMSKINMEMKRVQMDKDMSGEGKRLELDRLRGMRNLITEEVGKQLEQDKMAKRASGGQ